MAINEKKAYAAYYDNDIRMKSSSGAIFSLLANEVLEKKGIVTLISPSVILFISLILNIF